jgi:hypothetical protein
MSGQSTCPDLQADRTKYINSDQVLGQSKALRPTNPPWDAPRAVNGPQMAEDAAGGVVR